MATAASTSAIPVVPTPVATTQPREGEPILIQMKGITSKVEFIDFVTRFMDKSSPVKQMRDWDIVVKFFNFSQDTASDKYLEAVGTQNIDDFELAKELTNIAVKTGQYIQKFFPSEEGISPEKDPLVPIKMQTVLQLSSIIKIEREMASLQS